MLIPANSHSPYSPLHTTRTVILVTRDYELDPRSKSRVAAIQIGSFLSSVGVAPQYRGGIPRVQCIGRKQGLESPQQTISAFAQ
eukprot:COSAG05_NODE_4439_length_1514_cov_20.359011_2_plen_84_part_00